MVSPDMIAKFGVSVALLGFGVIGLIGAVKLFCKGGREIILSIGFSNAEAVPPAKTPESGYAIVTGTVTEGDGDTLVAPFTGTDTIGYRHRIAQKTDGVGWWEVVDGGRVTPFELTGDRDTVHVDPGDQLPDLPVNQSTSIDSDNTLPEKTLASLKESTAFDLDEQPECLAEQVDEPRKYEEARIDIGQEIRVYGKVVSNGAGTKELVAAESIEFGLTKDSPEEIRASLVDHESASTSLLKGAAALVLGLIAIGIGLNGIMGVIGL